MNIRHLPRSFLERALPLVWFILLFVADFRFEHRSVLASAEGEASPRVITEFAAYSVVGGLAFVYLTRTRWLGTSSLGLDVLLGYGFIVAASALWSDIPLFSFIRGIQVVFIALIAKAAAGIWTEGGRSVAQDWRGLWFSYIVFVSMLGVWGVLFPAGGDGRFAWPGTHPITAGSYLGVAAALAVYLLLNKSEIFSLRTRAFLAAAGLWCMWLLLLTVARSALAATVVSLIMLLGLLAQRGSVNRRAALMLAAVLGVGVVWWFAPTVASYVLRDQSLEAFVSLTGRIPLWAYAMDLIWSSPFIGHGFGSGRILLTQAFPWGGTGHNLLIEIGLGLGFVGVAIVTTLLVWILRQSWLMVRFQAAPVALPTLALGVLLAVKSIGAETFAVPGFEMALIALLVAVISAQRNLLLNASIGESRSYASTARSVLAGRGR